MSANTPHVHILRLLGLHCLYYLSFMPLLAAMLLLFSPSYYALLAQARPTMQRILLVIAKTSDYITLPKTPSLHHRLSIQVMTIYDKKIWKMNTYLQLWSKTKYCSLNWFTGLSTIQFWSLTICRSWGAGRGRPVRFYHINDVNVQTQEG